MLISGPAEATDAASPMRGHASSTVQSTEYRTVATESPGATLDGSLWFLCRTTKLSNSRSCLDYMPPCNLVRDKVTSMYDIASDTFSEQNVALEQSGSNLISLIVHRRYRT